MLVVDVFPSILFDIMVHLLVHLVREIKFYGLVNLRWMYPIECYMKILNEYVKNQYRLEASIIERSIVEESIEFCLNYMTKANLIKIPRRSWLNRCFINNYIQGVNVVTKDREELLQAHMYILNNTNEVIPYLNTYEAIMKENNVR